MKTTQTKTSSPPRKVWNVISMKNDWKGGEGRGR